MLGIIAFQAAPVPFAVVRFAAGACSGLQRRPLPVRRMADAQGPASQGGQQGLPAQPARKVLQELPARLGLLVPQE